MGHTPDEITQNLAARWWWQVARRDDTRIARRLYRQPLVDGVSRLDEGARLDDFFLCLRASDVRALREQVHGTAIPRAMLPFVQDLLRYGRKPVFGIDSLQALPSLLCSDAALLPRVGCKAQQVRQGVCPRGRPKRQGERMPGPMCPDTLANHMVQGHVRALAAWCNGVRRALAKAGVVGTRVTGMAEGPALETTARDQGGGQAPRQRRSDDPWGRVQESAVTVDGWQLLVLIDGLEQAPLGGHGGAHPGA